MTDTASSLVSVLPQPTSDGSARSAEDTLNRITWTLLSLFLGLAVVLSAGWLK